MAQEFQLPDHIQPGIQILFVGINPGMKSAETGHHFSGPSNRFWKLLYEAGLVPEPLTYRDDWRLPEWGLGLTNIISRCSAGIDVLGPGEYRDGLASLTRKVRRYQPGIIALLGVTIYRTVFGQGRRLSSRLDLGMTTSRLAGTPVFLLPNPSGRNAHYSHDQMREAFCALRMTRIGREPQPIQLASPARRSDESAE
ncbi:MAG: mismatch-specific DNA-glycosylase [Nitrospira sp.]|nr:mismatch-specific DNA-glycosylase [Nitrospira sp.]